MARPVWSGTISFGLVAIPVKLFHAVRRQSVSFNQLDERNMARIRYRKVNAETGERLARAAEAETRALLANLRPLLLSGIDEAAMFEANLVSGFIDALGTEFRPLTQAEPAL